MQINVFNSKLFFSMLLRLLQVKIWFQNRRMKWRNTKERELLAAGTGCREQTLPTKNNPNPDLSDVTTSTSNNTSSSTVTPQMVTPTAGVIVTSATPNSSQQNKKNSNGNNGVKNHNHLIQQKQMQQKKINVAVDQIMLNRGGGPALVARQQQVL